MNISEVLDQIEADKVASAVEAAKKDKVKHWKAENAERVHEEKVKKVVYRSVKAVAKYFWDHEAKVEKAAEKAQKTHLVEEAKLSLAAKKELAQQEQECAKVKKKALQDATKASQELASKGKRKCTYGSMGEDKENELTKDDCSMPSPK
ncbi:hypothetical protein BS47DRAFT_1398770 [Hydnum rufescens UP504]|uniref:Uncharacterized protein n=1 Tax=Hydnum rufescens UP504 TaxID=1448309 RepID=A0A9P6DR68_9AGAM|nr:hypothetical protein BS47DRAFT_1398770 [Hydnum rufescens UP504]